MTGIAALGAGKVVGGFLLGNWKWLLPVAGMVAALGYGAVCHIGWERCAAARANDRANAEEAARLALELDAGNLVEIVAKAEAEKAVLRQEARERDDAINRAAPGACPDAGPYGALYNGVRARQQSRGGPVPGPAGR